MVQKGESRLRAVVVTGASSGIGEACALHLDELGFDVFATVLPGETAAVLRERGSGRLRVLELDVTDAAGIAAAADKVAAAVGEAGLAGLVNNAGVDLGGGPLEFVPIATLRRQFEVNVIGQIAVTQAFLPLLRKSRGRIVMMGSVAGEIVYPFLSPYAASKSALRSLTAALRAELRPWQIHVSIVIAGVVTTPIWEKAIRGVEQTASTLPPETQRLYGRAIAATLRSGEKIRRAGSPAAVVAVAVAHALTAEKPKERYVVGSYAGTIEYFRHPPLSDWVLGRLVRGIRLLRQAS